PSGKVGQRNGQSIYYGIDNVAGLEDHQDAAGDTDHQTGYGNIFESTGHFFGNGVWTPAHNKGTDDSHDQEGSGNISEAPALSFYAPDDHCDSGYQNCQNAFFTDTEGVFMYLIL